MPAQQDTDRLPRLCIWFDHVWEAVDGSTFRHCVRCGEYRVGDMTTRVFTGTTFTGQRVLLTVFDEDCAELAVRVDGRWGPPTLLIEETS